MNDPITTEGKDGLSQTDRLLPMLLPAGVAIEGRDPAALMLRAARLATQFNYYNFSNEIDGDWQGFFTSNFNILALMISALDFTPRIRTYDHQLSELRFAVDRTAFAAGYQALSATVTGLATTLTRLMKDINAAELPPDIDARMRKVAADITAISGRLPATPDPAATTPDPATDTPDSAADTLDPAAATPALEELHTVFSDLLIQFNRVQEITAYYRKGIDWASRQYAPHLGLFITFLQLYCYVSKELNGLPAVHLRFYYRDILGINPIAEVPDQVHLLLAPESNRSQIRLQKGEELSAEIPGRDQPLTYRLLDDITVSGTKIASLRTLYTARRALFTAAHDDAEPLLNKQLYQGDYPAIVAETLLKGASPTPWPLLGEDQEVLAMDQRKMSEASIGLLLASPLFYLTEGHRKILITIYFIPSTFTTLTDYISQFGKSSGKSPIAAGHELLSRCFNIDFTTAKGWCPVDSYSVTLKGNNAIQLEIELDLAAAAFTGYLPGIHGPDLLNHPLLPVLRLLLNNGSPHNALSFFRQLDIQRVQLHCHVQQFRQLRLQNSIGNLSPDSAFQPFGPLPTVGSYLDIRNTNVLNRYTTQLSARIEWMDLPSEPGGFTAWYDGCPGDITNDSFRVAVGALKAGSVQPAAAQQQTFALYCPNPDEDVGGPAALTCLNDIDMKRLAFPHSPLLAGEELEPEGFFRNGAIRIELIAPQQAYGHALFPRLFPEVAMYNARWWHRRKPLPNQPHTPRVKSVSLDYTLEHAESFRDPADSIGGLELIHQYPYGFRRIYPGRDLRTIPFLPSIDPGGHLHLGLQNAQKGEEISVLFQLEEHNYHHTAHATGEVKWSYLQDEEWVPMDKEAIVTDSTNNFINSGIVRLKLPDQLCLNNSTWPADLFWLRASVAQGAEAKSRVITIQTQAAVAERILGLPADSPSTTTAFSLPPGSITHQVRKVPGLRPVIQPFPSFGGRPAESDEAGYIRISERLRHKRRPLSAQDFEQLVLGRFPALAVVKCFGASDLRQAIYPGVDMQVIVIPRAGAGGPTSEQPKVNLAMLYAVKTFLGQFASPFINIEIGNPVYEKVKIACHIRLTDRSNSGSAGYYLKTLHDDIRQYLCPWIYSPGSEVKIGTRIFLPELLTFIRRRPYIAELTGFSVIHFFQVKDPETGELRSALVDSAVDPTDYIQGSLPESVLIPAEHHLITLMDHEGYDPPESAGIRDLSLGDELLVAKSGRHLAEGFDEPPHSIEDPDENFSWTFVNPKDNANE